ncbi:hypothetical protein [Rhizobium sp.]
MNFFRRDEARSEMRPHLAHGAMSAQASDPVVDPVGVTVAPQDKGDYEALGGAMERHEQASVLLMTGVSSVQTSLVALIEDHGRILQEVGKLRTESARLAALLSREQGARTRFEDEARRLAEESRAASADNGRLTMELDVFRSEFTKLQAIHQVVSDERNIFEARLQDSEVELRSQVRQYNDATVLMHRAQQELDMRSRELAAMREKLDTETAAHGLLMETSRRDGASQGQEIARLTEERSQLKFAMNEREDFVRGLNVTVANLRNELASIEERYKRLGVEFDTLQSTSAMEIAQLSSRHDAVDSKAVLAGKLLATAKERNRVTDDELHVANAELKRIKTDLVTIISRNERANEELARARAIATENELDRRQLAAQLSDMTTRLRDGEEARVRREREAEAVKLDLESRVDSDRLEIAQLRSSLETARKEARQLKTEHAILIGQLDAARSNRPRPSDAPQLAELAARTGIQQPIIEISDAALRSRADGAADPDNSLLLQAQPPSAPGLPAAE